MIAWTTRLLRLAQNLLAFLLLLSAAVSAAVALKFIPQITLAYVIFALLSVGVFAATIIAASRVRNDWTFAIVLTAIFTAIKLSLIFALQNYQQVGDCRSFASTMRYFCDQRMGDESLRELFRNDYDAHIWIVRAFPFSYPLAKLFPSVIVLVGQLSNVIACAAQNLLVFWLLRRWLPPRAARFGLVLLTLLPLHTWQALDYTHQFQGALFVVLATVALARIVEKARSGGVGWGAAILLGASLFILRTQGGIDLFMLVACAMLVALVFLLKEDRSAIRRILLAFFVGVILIFMPAARSFAKWTGRFDDLKQNSHPFSFLARGWNLPMWGEYYGTYEQIDRMTPRPQKRPTMIGLVASQITYEPVRTLVELPWAKFGKFFLVGFASNHEIALRDGGYEELTVVARASRHLFAPFFLALAAIGCWRWPRLAGNCAARWITGLLPLLFAMVYLVFGETSPRYSFHVHFALAMLAGVGLHAVVERFGTRRASAEKIMRASDVVGSFGAASGLTLLFVIASIVLPPLLKNASGNLLIADMRTSKILVPPNAQANGETVFDRVVSLAAASQPDGVIAAAEVPIMVGKDHSKLSFFFWPQMPETLRTNATVDFALDGTIVRHSEMNQMQPANLVELSLPRNDGGCKLRVEIRAPAQGGKLQAGAPAFRWGYIRTY